MRKHFTLEPALESYTSKNIISLEEEAVLIDEANTDATEAETELTEAERIIEVSDALEDLAVIADGIEEATPAEVALIENAGNMAVAGTDVAPEEVVPSLTETVVATEDPERRDAAEPTEPAVDENGVVVVPVEGETRVERVATEAYLGKRISTEAIDSIRNTAKKIWESIQKFLANIWDKIVSFFNKIFDTIPRLTKALEELTEKVKDSKDNVASAALITFNTGVAALSVNYKPVKSAEELKAGVANLTDVASYVFGPYLTNTAKRGEIIAKAISEFTYAESEKATEALRAALKSTTNTNFPKKGPAEKSRFQGFDTTASIPLLGNISLVDKVFNEKGDNSTLAALDRYRNSRLEVVATAEHIQGGISEVSIKPFSNTEMVGLLKDAKALLGIVAAYKTGPEAKAIEASKKAIQEASTKAEKEISAAKSDEGQAIAIANYRALLNFNVAYVRWAQSPAIPMLRHALAEVRTVMFVVSKSLGATKAVAA